MNKKFIKDSRGQINTLFGAVIGTIVLFVMISLGITLTNNFYVGTGQTPSFNSLWPLVAAGVGILVLIVFLFKMFT